MVPKVAVDIGNKYIKVLEGYRKKDVFL